MPRAMYCMHASSMQRRSPLEDRRTACEHARALCHLDDDIMPLIPANVPAAIPSAFFFLFINFFVVYSPWIQR